MQDDKHSGKTGTPRRQAVILAGGLATRLGPLAAALPKVLLPVAGRPFLEWQLEQLATTGYQEVLLCLGHRASQVHEHLARRPPDGLAIATLEDGARLLGTGGALRRAVPQLAEVFLVTYGDSFLPFDHGAPLRDLLAHQEAAATMAVLENRGRWDASNCHVEGELVVHYSKQSRHPQRFIDYGATAMRRDVLATYPANTPFGFECIQQSLARQGLLRALEAVERFYEIGSPAGLAETEAYLSQRAGQSGRGFT